MHSLDVVGKMHKWLAADMVRPPRSQNVPAAAAAAVAAAAAAAAAVSAAVVAAAPGRAILARVAAVSAAAAAVVVAPGRSQVGVFGSSSKVAQVELSDLMLQRDRLVNF